MSITTCLYSIRPVSLISTQTTFTCTLVFQVLRTLDLQRISLINFRGPQPRTPHRGCCLQKDTVYSVSLAALPSSSPPQGTIPNLVLACRAQHLPLGGAPGGQLGLSNLGSAEVFCSCPGLVFTNPTVRFLCCNVGVRDNTAGGWKAGGEKHSRDHLLVYVVIY